MSTLEKLLNKARAGGYGVTPAADKAPAKPVEVPELPISRNTEVRTSVTMDLLGEAGLNAADLLAREGIQVHYICNRHEADGIVAQLRQADVLGLDLETAKLPEFREHRSAGLDPHLSRIRLAQLYAGGSDVYVFDVFVLGLGPLAPLWDRPMVAHNALFELKHLMHNGISPTQVGCTMLQANALTGRLPKLAELVKEHLGWDMDKELQVSDWGAPELSTEQLAYAALDAVAVQKVAFVQRQKIIDANRQQCYRIMRNAQRTVVRLELNGIHFDLYAHGQLVSDWEKALAEAEAELRAVLGPDVNPASGQQLSNWLKGGLNEATLQAWPRTGTGQLKTDADTLAAYKDLPLVKPLLAFKVAAKNLSTYGQSYANHINPVTGRIHSSFRIGGTATGRFACHDPNIQNPPRDPRFRALFSAPPGRKMVVADYSQIELRVAACLSQDPVMLAAYGKGEDLHRKTAAAFARVAEDQVTKSQRQMAKAVNFGLLFGMGAPGLVAYAASTYGVSMTEKQAAKARAAFFKSYSGLQSWQERLAKKSKSTWQSITPGGRVRDFALESKGYKYTEALNTPVQGGAADVFMSALACLEDSLHGLDARLVNIVHDELVLEVAASDVEATKRAVEAAMKEGFLRIFPNAIETTVGLVEAESGANWADAKG